MRARLLKVVALLSLPWTVVSWARGQEAYCRSDDPYTNDYIFSASSAQGARGDVVGVDIFLTVETTHGDRLVAAVTTMCYDPALLELVGPPFLSPGVDAAAYITEFHPLLDGVNYVQHIAGEDGFVLTANLATTHGLDLIRGGVPVHFATAYFRIVGTPGDVASIRFCNEEFRLRGGVCQDNLLLWPGPLDVRSNRHTSASIRVLEGEAQHPDPPELPPEARVYPDAPTAETSEIVFELGGGVVSPGGRIALPFSITSSHEFVGFLVGLRFPPHLVRVAEVEEHIRPGSVQIDPSRGLLGLVLLDSTRRIGREGERVQVATVEFEVLPEAAGVSSLEFSFDGIPPWENWVAIRHSRGLGTDVLPVNAEVAPTAVVQPLVRVQVEPTWAGDVDLDYALTLTDAVITLEDLFGGGEPRTVCPQAADFVRDGTVNVSDAIGVLLYLFGSGSLPSPVADVYCE